MASSKQKQNKSLQEQMDRLDEIVNWFESESVDIDQSLQKFEEGMKLVNSIEQRLNTAKNEISVLKKKFDK